MRALKSSRVALEGRLEKARAEELSTRAAADALRADLDASRAAHQRANAVPVRTLCPSKQGFFAALSACTPSSYGLPRLIGWCRVCYNGSRA